MNVHISYKVRRTPDIDHEIQHWMVKIQKRLQVFRPDLIHLKGLVEQKTTRGDTTVSLNLRLPSGQMAVKEASTTSNLALKAAFADLLEQIGKHKELLRNSHRWRRRRTEKSLEAGVPFEQTIAAVAPQSATSDDVRAYVNVNFARLERFIERELFFRESAGEMDSGPMNLQEIVDEVVARALDDRDPKPDLIGLEPWIYRLARSVINNSIARPENDGSYLSVQGRFRRGDELASDESQMQFHQPDEAITNESSIQDERAANPEQIAYADEVVRLVDFALRHTSNGDREAFILHALEGFSAEEISSITARNLEDVRAAIARAREKVRAAFPITSAFKKKMVQHTGTD